MVGWHHRLNGYEFQQILGYSEGQGSLACCSSWDHKELDTMEQLSNKTVLYTGKPKFSHNLLMVLSYDNGF